LIQLRPFDESGFPRLIAWIGSHEDLVQWAGPSQFTFPLTDDQLKSYLAEAQGERGSRRAFTAIDGAGMVCGHIELGAINHLNQTATLCRVCVAPELRGKGICLPMVQEVMKIGFEELGLRRIDLRVYSFNASAIRCYERAGFVREGLLRKLQKIGDNFWDTVLMAILREEWIPHNPEERDNQPAVPVA